MEVYHQRQNEEYLESLLQGLTHHESRIIADELPVPYRTASSSEGSAASTEKSGSQSDSSLEEEVHGAEEEMDVEAETLPEEDQEISGEAEEAITKEKGALLDEEGEVAQTTEGDTPCLSDEMTQLPA